MLLDGEPNRSAARENGPSPVVQTAHHHRLARVTDSELPFFTRLWFAWAAFFRVLFNGTFAARVYALRDGRELEPKAIQPAPAAEPAPAPAPAVQADPLEGAFQLLGLLQREGRFVDFIQQDIAGFGDSDVGAAARVVHEGCRRALTSHARIVNVRTETEGATVVVDKADGDVVKLTGDVSGQAPYRGVLRHRGWRIETLKLPQRVGLQDLRVVAPAEVEL
jgi:hypothetical protein